MPIDDPTGTTVPRPPRSGSWGETLFRRLPTKGPRFRSMSKGDKLSDNPMTRFDVLHMIERRAQAAGLPTPPVVTLSVRPASLHISKMWARSSTPRPSPSMNLPERPSFTIAPERSFPSTKWRGSKFKPVLPLLQSDRRQGNHRISRHRIGHLGFRPLDSASIEASARARSLADATAFYATISKFVSTATQLVRRQP